MIEVRVVSERRVHERRGVRRGFPLAPGSRGHRSRALRPGWRSRIGAVVAVTLGPLSILDLASVGEGESIAESFVGSVALARLAERAGYRRVWYAEHHNIPSIASSATAGLIAPVAPPTSTLPLRAGG